MNDLTKLPVTVVTGFLGSGKTTLIRHLMQNPGGKRLAIIVNEFGDVGVDGEIQLTDAINAQSVNNVVEAVTLNGRRFDCGSVKGYLDAIIHLAGLRK